MAYNQYVINTSYGAVTIELFADKAPVTVANFLSYMGQNFYDGTIFHRVVDRFVIQGGGYSTDLTAKTTAAPIVLESNNGLSNLRGTIGMARTNAADSATSQFYINTVDNTGLNYKSATSPGYAVFGRVTAGMQVVDAIENAHTFNVTTGSGATLSNLPFPGLVAIWDVAAYTAPAIDAPATTHTTTTTAQNVSVAQYSGNRASYGVELNANNTLSVTQLDGQHNGETLAGVARLEFADSKWAFDMAGSAGKSLKLINAAFGYKYLTPSLVTSALGLFDQGQTMEAVAAQALGTAQWLTVAGGSDNASFVKAVYSHVVGQLPDAATQAVYQGMLDRGEKTQTQLLADAALSDANATFVDLVGFAHSGLQYA